MRFKMTYYILYSTNLHEETLKIQSDSILSQALKPSSFFPTEFTLHYYFVTRTSVAIIAAIDANEEV